MNIDNKNRMLFSDDALTPNEIARKKERIPQTGCVHQKPLVVMAIMQNFWAKDPDGVRAMLARYDQDPDHRRRLWRRLIATSLFAGCLTGRRLKQAFGEELCSRIIWEESTPEIAGDSKKIFPADSLHIRTRILEEEAHLILAVGKIAWEATVPIALDLMRGGYPIKVEHCVHPAARGEDTMSRVIGAAARFKRRIAEMERVA